MNSEEKKSAILSLARNSIDSIIYELFQTRDNSLKTEKHLFDYSKVLEKLFDIQIGAIPKERVDDFIQHSADNCCLDIDELREFIYKSSYINIFSVIDTHLEDIIDLFYKNKSIFKNSKICFDTKDKEIKGIFKHGSKTNSSILKIGLLLYNYFDSKNENNIFDYADTLYVIRNIIIHYSGNIGLFFRTKGLKKEDYLDIYVRDLTFEEIYKICIEDKNTKSDRYINTLKLLKMNKNKLLENDKDVIMTKEFYLESLDIIGDLLEKFDLALSSI